LYIISNLFQLTQQHLAQKH